MMIVKASTTDGIDSNTRSGKGYNEACISKASHRKCMGESLIGCKCCAKHLNENFEIFLVDQGVLQMNQISSSCVIVSMSY